MSNQNSSRGQDSSNFDQVILDGQSPIQLEQNISVRGPGYSNGPAGGGWTTIQGITQNMFAWRRGITQLFGGLLQKFAVGDSVVAYFYNKTYGGATAGSDEGSGIISGKRTPPTTYFHGTVATTSGTGDQAPTLTFTTGNNVMIDGGFLLNITKATVSGSLNGASSILSLETFSGIAPTYLKKLPVTGVSLPTTTAAGVATAAITNSAVLSNAPVSKTITVNLVKIGGVFPVFAINDVVTVAGSNFVEQSKITAAGAASGTQQQTISLALRYPNAAAILFRGGIQGTAISFTANLALSGIRSSYPAVGSMTGTDLIFAFSAFGDTTTTDLPQVGAEAATTSGASAAFLLCPYAEVVDNLTFVGTSTLEQNRVAWATSDVVENPPNPAQLDTGVFWDVLYQYPQTIQGTPAARFLFVNGPGFGGPSISANWIRSNNLGSLYQGGGGPLIAPVLNQFTGVYGEHNLYSTTPDNGRYHIKILGNYAAGQNFKFINLDYVSNGTITFDHTNQRWVLPRVDVTQYFVGGTAGIDATTGGLTFNKGLLTAGSLSGDGLFSGITPPTKAGTSLTSQYGGSGGFTSANTTYGISISDTTIASPGNLGAVVRTYPGVAFTVSALISFPMQGANFHQASLMVANTLSTQSMTFGIQYNSGVIALAQSWTNPTTFSASLVNSSINVQGRYFWLRYQDNGTNLTYSISTDNQYYQQIYTVSKASSFLGSGGFNYIGFGLNPQTASIGSTLMAWILTTP